MKKRLAVLLSLTLALAFALAACGGGGSDSGSGDLSDSKYVGTWVTDTVSFAGESGELGQEFKLTLNDDGTGTLEGTDADGNEEVSEFTWSPSEEGVKTKGDVKVTFKEDGDAIVASIFGAKLRFVREAAATEEPVETVDGSAYGYAGDDPVEAACYQYMAETIAKDFEAADASIPTVYIVSKDESPENEVLVYGDFSVDNYNINGDVLETASGGNFPGCMHVSKDDYTVTAFDVVADGEAWDSSAKEIFGENYDAFIAAHDDTDAYNELRKKTVSDYVKLNGLEVTKYQDYGWDPVELNPAE